MQEKLPNINGKKLGNRMHERYLPSPITVYQIEE